jgi:hypothetical protein
MDVMKLIKVRDRVDKGILGAALILASMPVIGLLTGTAFGTTYTQGYFEALLSVNSDKYCIFLAYFDFPLIKNLYERLGGFKRRNKMIYYLGIYLILPICIVAFVFLLPFIL